MVLCAMKVTTVIVIFGLSLNRIQASENNEIICGDNEHWDDCPGFCPRDSCAKFNPDFTCPQLPAIPLPCRPDCVCNDGYLRNPAGICVKEAECPKDQTCGVNEKFNKNRKECPGDSCRLVLIRVNCIANQTSIPGCECKKGYLRDKYDQCIRRDQCPEAQKCPVNEIYNLCGTYCPITCKNRFMPPSACILACKEGCDCAPDFYRHDNGTCVQLNECSPPECTENSHFEECTGPCDTSCNDDICAETCVPGCVCNKGYFKKFPWECAKFSDNPIKCTGINEEPSYCAQVCPPQSCEISYTEYACPKREYHQGCNCINGYLRNETNHCIPSDQCPPPNPCGLHEVWSDNTNCQKTCGNKKKKSVEEPEAGCICKDGYARDGVGNCIPEDKCNSCPKNEMWVECMMGMCVPKTCDELGYPVACPDLSRPCQDPGCVCTEGYVRNSAGICIPVEQCPSCGGDFNATSGCSNYCGNSCSDYKDHKKVCPEICEYNGCNCRQEYVYDDIVENKCIKAEDCPSKIPN